MRKIFKWPAKLLFELLQALESRKLSNRLRRLSLPSNGVVVVLMIKNEALRLPYFLSYYRDLGVTQFIVLDHGSTDNTAQILDAAPDTARFAIKGSFAFKATWINAVLNTCCKGRWTLVLDADEFLVYPGMEHLSLDDFLAFLDSRGEEAMHCRLLDMFPEGNVNAVPYRPGQDPLEVAPFYDSDGATRKNTFGVEPDLNKAPLFRFADRMELKPGQHVLTNAKVTPVRGALLHFKFLQDFQHKNESNVVLRTIDRDYSNELEAYKKRLGEQDELVLHSDTSERYSSPDQLVQEGIMVTVPELDALEIDTSMLGDTRLKVCSSR